MNDGAQVVAAPTHMRRWRRYPEYRVSGVEWLGEVPAEWNLRPLGFSVDTVGGGTPSRSDSSLWHGDIPWVSPKDMKVFRLEDSIEHVNDAAINVSAINLITPPAVLIVVRGMILAHTFPVALTRTPVTINQDMKALSPRAGLDATWLAWTLSGLQWVMLTEVDAAAHGTCCLRTDRWKRIAMPVPSLLEQRAIAAFLDRETARIDALVERKRRLIALLHEKRAAVITRAVTGGLDPSASTKDSGVEWLGEVPAHWSPTRLMFLTQPRRAIMYGIVLPGPNVPDGVPIVKGGDVAPGRLRLDFLNRTAYEIEAGYERSRLRPRDIVYAIRGSIGMAELVPDELDGANLTQDAARIAPRTDLNRRWLLYAVRSAPVFAQLDARATGATIRGINIKDLKRAVVPVPPPAEQEAIADHLDHETARIDALIARLKKSITLLDEHRQALITAAVTGQIDVRGEAPS